MSASKSFRKHFSRRSLKTSYFEKVRFSCQPGSDGVNRRKFESVLDQEIEIINRKVLAGTYRFSRFEEKLISKGATKLPRIISIPTIRDKVALKSLSKVLLHAFEQDLQLNSSYFIIDQVKKALAGKTYSHFVKFDISTFFSSIPHSKLIGRLSKRIRKSEIVDLVSSALTQRTGHNLASSTIGIPQGLSISAVLANIYLCDIDSEFRARHGIEYFRFVDDVLILCNESDLSAISTDFKERLSDLGLSINKEKSTFGPTGDEILYLGYRFVNEGITVRVESVNKLIDSIIHDFSQYKYSTAATLSILEWRVNKRITGFIFEEKKYGWMFYYAQINDLEPLYHLDRLVEKLGERFLPSTGRGSFKRFVRAYYEINYNLRDTTYIPNFDSWSVDEKRQLLTDIFRVRNVSSLSDASVEYNFRTRIHRLIKDFERDVRRTS